MKSDLCPPIVKLTYDLIISFFSEPHPANLSYKVMNVAESTEQFDVLLIGNNPIELSKVFDSIRQTKGKRIITEIAFDLQSGLQRLIKFRPSHIVIDDNIGKQPLSEAVKILSNHTKTKNVPITVIKNSNYLEAVTFGVMNYILKDNLTGDSLFVALRNSLKFKKTQEYLVRSYRKRKGKLLRALSNLTL